MTLTVRDLTVIYRHRPAVHGVSFDAPSRAVTGIIGPNGAGKSTVLKAVMGLIEPTAGSAAVDGHPIDEVRARVAYLPQRSALDWDYPAQVREVVAMGRFPHRRWGRRASAHDHRVVDEALERVGLTELGGRQIGELSGGQQQRMLLARSLAQEASTLLLDEPFVGIDAATVAMLSELLSLLAESGVCVVLVNHDLMASSELCDHVVLLNRRVIASGPAEAVLTSDWIDQTYAAQFFDSEVQP